MTPREIAKAEELDYNRRIQARLKHHLLPEDSLWLDGYVLHDAHASVVLTAKEIAIIEQVVDHWVDWE